VTERAERGGRLVWVDCEMTGLDLARDALIEVAAIVTDAELQPLDDGVEVVIHAADDLLDTMVAVVRDMHAASGLTDAVRASTTPLGEAEKVVLEYVRSHVPEPKSAPLCGNSIATDRGFLARDMPGLDEFLHYRMIDVSSIKELAKRWYPRVYQSQPEKGLRHRALDDIRESITELAYYRRTLFVPLPGPSAEQAQAAAREVLGGEAAGADR
jgi:oligoribonuclease